MCAKIACLEVKPQLPYIIFEKSEYIILDLYYTIFEYEMKIYILFSLSMIF